MSDDIHPKKNQKKSLEDEILRILSIQGSRVPIPVFLCAILLASFVYDNLPILVWSSWLVWIGVFLVIRWVVLAKLPTLTSQPNKVKLNVAIILSGINGVSIGLSLFFFPYLSEYERAIQSLVLVGLSAGSVVTTAGHLPIFLAYLLPILPPLAILWLVNPGLETGSTHYIVATLVIMFCALLISLARDSFRLLKNSVEIRLEQITLNKRLRIALDDAESANMAKTRFLASASHDLRQPIHTLSLFGAALSMRPLDDRSRDITNHMNIALQVLANQLDALLDVSKLDAGVVQVNETTINLNNFLKRMYDDHLSQAKEKGNQLRLTCANELYLNSDEMLLERILRNLLTNAIKYTVAGQIDITVKEDDQWLMLTIADTGHGIEKSEQKNIFEEFYQLDNPQRDRKKGLGLGLSIVKRLVNLLEIALTLHSTLGQGSEFCLRLERVRPEEAVENNAPPNLSLHDWKNRHILVVDDEYEGRYSMKTLLEETGCTVSLAKSTTQAFEVANHTRPDILLSDLRLIGDDNGLKTITTLRTLYPNLPAILISGDTAPDCLKEAIHAKVELLHKPVSIELLKRSIIRACQRQENAAGNEI